ncbi:MAG: winged helix-turn-helix domain-containing protein [Alicyclobacillus macrosporangiidus]|uniref:winged helix-turn-helix domain-containing protein n=1 Tax=Alicyclobacillus macrosporangiidus TaxID=392015 RepID=UPI0026EBC330|nr:winged helix-turn-helix domain-containing protein [Alicyclobacillus macrosporangiidus]MCL6599124.1 winged helix-turn-helix domain-containing protein [Alicyclobacillus macrosporangiidus]
MKSLTFLQLAERVLTDNKKTMTPEEIWTYTVETHLANSVGSHGKTPWRTIEAQIYVDLRDKPSSPFVKCGVMNSKEIIKEKYDPVLSTEILVLQAQKMGIGVSSQH